MEAPQKEDGRFSPMAWMRHRTPSLPSCIGKRKLSFLQKLHSRKKSAPHLRTPDPPASPLPPSMLPLPTSKNKNSSRFGTPCRTPESRSPVPPRGFEPIDKPNPCQTPVAPYLAPGTPYLAPGTPSLQYLPNHPPGNDRNGNLKSCGQIQCCLQILYLEQKLFEKDENILRLRRSKEDTLAHISRQLFVLQANLIRKEKYLDQLIMDREQTIMEQQRIIRRLLRRRLLSTSLPDKESDEKAPSPPCSDQELCDPDTLVPIDDTVNEISISVPNLADRNMNIIRPIIEYNRSISENEGVEQRAKEERALKVKNERRMSNRQKLLAMKRYSGYLKRPEILETVYSVEEDCTEAGKPGEVSAENSQEQEAEPEQEQEQEQEQKEETRGGLRKFRIDSDITDYDYSTDSESLRFFFSETDPSGCNTGCNTSELCSRRSSCGSQPNLLDVGKDGTEDSSKSRSMEDLRGKLKQQPHPLPEMKAIDRRRRMFQQHTSVSLDCNDK